MYRLLISTITYLLVSVHIAQAQEDIVMKIGDHPVYKNEFVSEYRKSHSTSVREFLPRFVARKIRVLDLQDRGIDTLTSFRILLANYQGEKLKSHFLDKYKSTRNGLDADRRFTDKRWIKYQLIEKYIPQNSSRSEVEKARQSSDSIYNALKAGADFDALSMTCSDRKEDVIPHWSRLSLLPAEIISSLDNAKVGDIIAPVLTASGYNIVRVNEIVDNAPDEVVDKEMGKSVWESETLCDVPFDDLKSELLYKLAVANDSVSCEITEKDIRDFYSSNASRYYYDEPRFKGAVLHCSSKKMTKVIRKYLKRYEYNQWQDAIGELTKNETVPNVKIETGIFKKGDNRFVDRLVFKDGSEMVYSSSLPFSFTMGKKVKKKPDSLDDVRDIVRADVLNERIMQQNHDLVDKYKVEIDNDVLKTVNNSGSN